MNQIEHGRGLGGAEGCGSFLLIVDMRVARGVEGGVGVSGGKA